MQRYNSTPASHSRRWFVGAVGVGLGSAVIGADLTGALPQLRLEAVRFFDVVHAPSVAVWMSNGDPFVVVVKDVQSGDDLERHEGVTAWNLLELRSDHLQVVERT